MRGKSKVALVKYTCKYPISIVLSISVRLDTRISGMLMLSAAESKPSVVVT